MKIKVIFEDGNVIETKINCSLQDARTYYLNNYFTFGIGSNEKQIKAISVQEA